MSAPKLTEAQRYFLELARDEDIADLDEFYDSIEIPRGTHVALLSSGLLTTSTRGLHITPAGRAALKDGGT